MMRRRIKQTTSLEERLAEQAKQIREMAAALPPGKERDDMMQRARQAETASQINQWVSSAALLAPK
jgi:hypothetical protein